MRFLLLICFSIVFIDIFGQGIRVLDRTDLMPVENVYIYLKTHQKSGISNRNGEIQFTQLKPDDTLVFQHPSYTEVTMPYSLIASNRHQVFLSLRTYNLGQITVSANRWEDSQKDLPAKITTIEAREAMFRNPQTTADLLAQTHEVYVQKSQLGGGSPMLRGFAANSVLLVVDGVRMNNAIYRSGNLQNVISLDANFIDKTEVIFGPGSVIYGSDALGGVMIFNTHQPRFSMSDSLAWAVKSLARYSSVNNEKAINLSIDYGRRRWSGATSVSWSDFGDLRAGSIRSKKFPDFGKRTEYVIYTGIKDSIAANPDVNKATPSGYKQFNISQKVRFKPSNSYEISYGFHFSNTSDIPRYDRLIEYRQGKLRFAEWFYGPQNWMMHNLAYSIKKSNIFFDEGKISTAYQFNEESRHERRLNQFVRTSRIEKVHAYILNTDFQKHFTKQATLYYGFEGLFNSVISRASALNIKTLISSGASTRYPDGSNRYGGLAAYALYKYRPAKKMVVHTGMRYSRIMLESRLIDTVFYKFPFREISIHAGAICGSVGMALQLNQHFQVNTTFSTGFRAPNLDDAGKIFESTPRNVVVPNPGLKPEYALNGEIGIVLKYPDRIQAEFIVFYTHLTDVMVRRDFKYLGKDSIMYNGELSRVQAVVNAGEGYKTGSSANLWLRLTKNLDLRSSLTYSLSKETGISNPVPLPHTPPLFGATTLIFNARRTQINASVVYNGAKKWNDLDPSEQAKTHMYTTEGSLAWYTLSLKASYQVLAHLQLNIGIENILDQFYWPYASGIPAPGRNVYVALRGSFFR